MAKLIYVASSWRNKYQPSIIQTLREKGHNVYDFRNPAAGDYGFLWSDIDPNWKGWTLDAFIKGLNNDRAINGFHKDYYAIKWADICILVLPCGRSAHLEAGWFVGVKKTLIIYIPEKIEPELMYKMGNYICGTMERLLEILEELEDE